MEVLTVDQRIKLLKLSILFVQGQPDIKVRDLDTQRASVLQYFDYFSNLANPETLEEFTEMLNKRKSEN